jgi:hypothetical protein
LSQQTYLLSEFARQAPHYEIPTLSRGVVHAHCYHTSVLKTDAEKAVLSKIDSTTRC